MSKIESLYEKIITELGNKGKIRTFTEEENIKAMEELNSEDLDDYLREQRTKQTESELELKTIFLN